MQAPLVDWSPSAVVLTFLLYGTKLSSRSHVDNEFCKALGLPYTSFRLVHTPYEALITVLSLRQKNTSETRITDEHIGARL
jgi:hypothetical protein